MDIRDISKDTLLEDMKSIKRITEFYIYDNDLNKHHKKINKIISAIKNDKLDKLVDRKEID